LWACALQIGPSVAYGDTSPRNMKMLFLPKAAVTRFVLAY
jgi:hypothetical protein